MLNNHFAFETFQNKPDIMDGLHVYGLCYGQVDIGLIFSCIALTVSLIEGSVLTNAVIFFA